MWGIAKPVCLYPVVCYLMIPLQQSSSATQGLSLPCRMSSGETGMDKWAAPGANAQKYIPVCNLGSGSCLFPTCVTLGKIKTQWEKIWTYVAEKYLWPSIKVIERGARGDGRFLFWVQPRTESIVSNFFSGPKSRPLLIGTLFLTAWCLPF